MGKTYPRLGVGGRDFVDSVPDTEVVSFDVLLLQIQESDLSFKQLEGDK